MRKRTQSASRRLPRSRHPGDRASNSQSASASWRAAPPNNLGGRGGRRGLESRDSGEARPWVVERREALLSLGFLAGPWLDDTGGFCAMQKPPPKIQAPTTKKSVVASRAARTSRSWVLLKRRELVRGAALLRSSRKELIRQLFKRYSIWRLILAGNMWLQIFGCKTHTFKRRCL